MTKVFGEDEDCSNQGNDIKFSWNLIKVISSAFDNGYFQYFW